MIYKIMKLSVTNCFLLKAGKNYVLVDTGYEWEWKALSSELQHAGIDIHEINYLFITHHHDDHAGLINQLIKENPNIKVVMSQKAKELLQIGQNKLEPDGGFINKRIYLLASLKKLFDKKWTLSFPPYKARSADIIINGNTSLRKIGIELDGKIIETPGHSCDSISIVLDNGDCIAGDAAANYLQFAGTKHCVVYIGNLEQYYKSWTILIEEGAKNIYPSHGLVFNIKELKNNIGRNKSRKMVVWR
jgi:glyoxylase-like metal-dependent hydrolase (beta-lactamase superfamily II)